MHRSLIAAAALLAATPLSAQAVQYPFRQLPYPLDSGYLANPDAAARAFLVGEVSVPGAISLVLHFDRTTNLAAGSRLRLTSVADGAIELFDAHGLADYQNRSSWFNGDRVRVEVVAAPGSDRNRVTVAAVWAGEGVVAGPSTICGPVDDRQPSTDPRVGRQHPTGCTSWLIDKHTIVTAGHCTSSASQEVHFNVPPSSSNGSIVLPPPSDQYRYDAATLRRLNSGVGADWAVASTLRNATTGLYAGQAQGDAFELAVPPAFGSGQQIRITGCGTTSPRNARSQTQQTHLGPRVNSANTTAMAYQTDTTGGNSGSPVILEATDQAVGVHTHGGCTSSNTGNNWGTAYNRADWQAAVRSVTALKRPGCFEQLGRGCPVGRTAPQLVNDGFPDLGRQMSLVLTGVPASAPVAFLLGGELGTPIDLTPIRMDGCLLYVDVLLATLTGADGSGRARMTFTTPNVSSLIGGEVATQAAAGDASANPLGVSLSNAGLATIGQ